MFHLTRFFMYRRIEASFSSKLTGRILGISGIDPFRHLIDKRAEVLDLHYPEIDMQQLPFESDSFDFVISDQVIEHLENPQKAIDETCRILKKEGVIIHTTCFINHIHHAPKDYWRFSPDALRYLCRDFSEIISCGGWGNRFAILLCFLSYRFRYMKIPSHRWSLRHTIATYNEDRYPIVTWVIARK